MITAIGLELSHDTEMGAVATAGRPDGARKYDIDLAYYGPADGAVTAAAGVYAATECCGTWLDPMACAGLLDDLRNAGVWLHTMTAVEVASASYLFKSAVRGRRVKTSGHEALKAAMQYAIRRPLAAAFAFERRKVPADMSALNAAAFGYFGLRRNEGGEGEPGVWVLGGEDDAPRLPPEAAGPFAGPGMSGAPATVPGTTMEPAGERYQGPPLGWPLFGGDEHD